MMIPPFYFPHGYPTSPIEQDQRRRKILAIVKHLYGYRPYLTEANFIAVTKSCGLPRYMNLALFQKMMPCAQENRITYAQFVHSWMLISKDRYDDESLYYSVLKKNEVIHEDWLTPLDFLPVLQDVVGNHPSLQFLSDNSVFQERYIETVICRLFYDADCSNGKMTLKQFRKSQFTERIKNLGSCTELNNTFGSFSYKHFYVIYCKFWTLDRDHDLNITASDLMEYNDRSLSPRIAHRIIQCGRVVSFPRKTPTDRLSFLDFIWFLLNEVDKTSPKAIEYWFRCMDEDGDGIISSYELELYWHDQITQQTNYNKDIMNRSNGEEDLVRFDDILRQMNDLIQPQQLGQFRLHDLKRNGYLAERFFDTFIHFNKFQLHESHQGCLRLKLQAELDKIKSTVNSLDQRTFLHGADGLEDIHFSYLIFSDWADYAEAEFQQMLMIDHQEAKHEDLGSEEEEEDIIDNYEQQQQQLQLQRLDSEDTSVLALSNQPFFETDEDCTYHTLMDDPPTTDDQIDMGGSGRNQDSPGDYLEDGKNSYNFYHSYYSYLSSAHETSDLGDTPLKKDAPSPPPPTRGEQTSDLEEEESDSTPSTPTSTTSKHASSVLLDSHHLASEHKDDKRTSDLLDHPIHL